MTKSKNLGLNLPSRDNTTDLADINVVSENFEIIDNEFENVYNKLNNTGVVNTVSGNPIVLKDSANAPLQNLKLYGSTEQSGTPTPDAPVPLVSVGDSGSFEVGVYGKQLLNVTANTQTIKGITYTVNDDKSISISGTPTDTTSWKNLTVNSAFNLPNGRYKLTCSGYKDLNNCFPVMYYKTDDGSKTLATLTANKDTVTFEITTGKNKVHLIIGCNPTYTPQGERLYISIFPESVTDLSYEPCNKQIFTMPYTLRGTGDIKDEIDFARGARIQRCASVDLGTLNWAEANNGKQMSSGSILGQVLRPIDNNTSASIICSAYQVDNANNIWNGIKDKSIGINTNGTIVVCDSNYTNATEFKNAMSGVILQYTLVTPIETPLTETELNAYRQLHTNKPTTTILSEADMELDYIADTKTYIDNKFAELSALILEV